MAKPVIGITTDMDLGISSKSISPGREYYFLCKNYIDAIQKAGGVSLLIPCLPDESYIDEVVRKISGLLLCGGVDIHPHVYQEEPHILLGAINPDKSKFEIMVIKRALAQNIPILGICGGEQLLNIADGGTLYQDIPSHIKNCISHKQRAPRWFPYHTVSILEDTKLYSILKTKSIKVNSYHHQAVKELGNNTIASAFAPDGVIEAIELKNHVFALGVQWHPEDMFEKDAHSRAIFQEFIKVCREQKL